MQKINKVFKFIFRLKIIVPLLILALAFAAFYFGEKRKKKNLDELLTAQITKGDISLTVQKEGSLQPKKAVEITSRVSGRINSILVKEGSLVKKGQKLAVISPGQSDYDKFVPVNIYSPMDGLVLRCLNERSESSSGITFSLPEEGKFISGSQDNSKPTCIMKVITPGKYSIPVKIGEYEINKIKKNMPVTILISSQDGVSYPGFISFVSPQPEIKEENYWDENSTKVEFVTVAETNGQIKENLIGLSATVRIELNLKKDVLIVPNSAIYEEMDHIKNTMKFFVYKNTEGRKAKKIQVKLGIRNDNDSELLNVQESGLKEKDTLIIDIYGDSVEII